MSSKQLQFVLAARVGRVGTLVNLLQEPNGRDSFLNYAEPENQSTALHLASYYGHAGCVQVLLEHKAQLEVQSSGGATPLCAAVSMGQVGVADLLLKAGANARARLANGQSCVHLAVTCTVHNAAPRLLRLLREAGADLDSPDATGRTPLLYAIEKERSECVQALLELGCSKEKAHPGTEASPLFLAIHNGLLPIAEMLLRAGANASAPQQDNATPAHIAAQRNQAHLLELLLHWGADPNHQDRSGVSVLHVAAASGSVACIDTLAGKFGAQVNSQDGSGRTPLYVAASKNHTAAVALLLAKGADPDIANSSGTFPLDTAARHGHLGPCKLLAPLASRSQLQAALRRAEGVPEGAATAAHLSESLDALASSGALPRSQLEATCALVFQGLAQGTHSLAFQRRLWEQGKRERTAVATEGEMGTGMEETHRLALNEVDANTQRDIPTEGANKRLRI